MTDWAGILEDNKDWPLLQRHLGPIVENPYHQRYVGLLKKNHELVNANVQLKRRARQDADKANAWLIENCKLKTVVKRLEAGRSNDHSLEESDKSELSNTSSALGESWLADSTESSVTEQEPLPGSPMDQIPEPSEGVLMKRPGRRTTKFNLDFEETTDDLDLNETEDDVKEDIPAQLPLKQLNNNSRKSRLRKTIEAQKATEDVEDDGEPEPVKLKLPGRRTTRFHLDLDETEDDAEEDIPAPLPAKPLNLRKSRFRKTMQAQKAALEDTVEEVTEISTIDVEGDEAELSPGGAKIKRPGRRTTKFALDFDVTVDAEDDPSCSATIAKKRGRPRKSTQLQNSSSEKEIESHHITEVKMKAPGRRTTKFNLDFDLTADETNPVNQTEEISSPIPKRTKKNSKPFEVSEDIIEHAVDDLYDRRSRRARKEVTYKEPSLMHKIRRGDAMADDSFFKPKEMYKTPGSAKKGRPRTRK